MTSTGHSLGVRLFFTKTCKDDISRIDFNRSLPRRTCTILYGGKVAGLIWIRFAAKVLRTTQTVRHRNSPVESMPFFEYWYHGCPDIDFMSWHMSWHMPLDGILMARKLCLHNFLAIQRFKLLMAYCRVLKSSNGSFVFERSVLLGSLPICHLNKKQRTVKISDHISGDISPEI